MARFLGVGLRADRYDLELFRISKKGAPMDFLRNVSGRSAVTSLAAALFLLTVLSGCGDNEKREYAVPEKLCSMPVDMDALASFLPPGKELTMHPKTGKTADRCEVKVDKRTVFMISQNWWLGGKDTANYARGWALKVPEKSAANGRYLYSERDGFGKTDGCVDDRTKEELYTAVEVIHSEHRDADAMKRVIINFTEAVQRSAACDKGPSTKNS